MKKHLAATRIQKIVRGKQVRQHLAIKRLISTLKKDGTPEKCANNISQKLLNSLKDGCLNLSYLVIPDKILRDILPLLSVLNVTTLNLNSNDIGPEGAKAIAETLTKNTSLTALYIGNNQIGLAGAKALAKALEENTSLTELYLGGNNIGPEEYKALADSLKNNTSMKKLDN